MRVGRIKVNSPCYYHVISRIVDCSFKLVDEELSIFMEILRMVEKFTGVRVIDYVIMSDHIHLILFASGICLVGEDVLIERFEAFYGWEEAQAKKERWKRFRKAGNKALVEEEKDSLRKRMDNISEFMKSLKQRYTMGYNKRHNHKGTLWEGRFKSILLDPKALPIVSAYIALNPVRAKMVTDPKDYLFSGYGAALGGDSKARKGILEAYRAYGESEDWTEISERHRMIIYGYGGKQGIHPPVFDREHVKKVLAAGGKLSLFELLRCRVRYFISGFAFGTMEFVEKSFQEHPTSFGATRKTGSRHLRGYAGELGEFYVARDLRKDVITPMKA